MSEVVGGRVRRYSVAPGPDAQSSIHEFESRWWPRARAFRRREATRLQDALDALASETGGPLDREDVFDGSTGALSLRDWQVATLRPESPAGRLLALAGDRRPDGSRSLQADSRLLLRGALYYPGLSAGRAVLRCGDLTRSYLEACAAYADDAAEHLAAALSPAAVPLLGSVMDNVRGSTLTLLPPLSVGVKAWYGDVLAAMALDVSEWFVDLVGGYSSYEILLMRAARVVAQFEDVIHSIRSDTQAVRHLARAIDWAWRREADDVLTCIMSARFAIEVAPELLGRSLTLCGIARSGIETAFVLRALLHREFGTEVDTMIWLPSQYAFRTFGPGSRSHEGPVIACDDSSATGNTLDALASALGGRRLAVEGVVLAHGPEAGRGSADTAWLTDPSLYGTHVVGMSLRSPLERRHPRQGVQRPDEPLVRDKQKERVAGYLLRAGPTTLAPTNRAGGSTTRNSDRLLRISDVRERRAWTIIHDAGLLEVLGDLGEVHIVGSVALGAVFVEDVDLLVLVDELPADGFPTIVEELERRGIGPARQRWLGDGVRRRVAYKAAVLHAPPWQLDLCFSQSRAYRDRSPTSYVRHRRRLLAVDDRRRTVLEIKDWLRRAGLEGVVPSNSIYDFVLATPDPSIDRFRDRYGLDA